jgi:hypothetical protein
MGKHGKYRENTGVKWVFSRYAIQNRIISFVSTSPFLVIARGPTAEGPLVF